MRLTPALAVLTTGLALYLSRGVLDQTAAPEGLVRVALLPPWQALAGFVGLGALGLLWLDRIAPPRSAPSTVALAPFVLPLFGLLSLVVPYLPVVPDQLPALQMLAGPLRGVIWLAVVAQLISVLWHSRIIRVNRRAEWARWQMACAIGGLTVLVSGTAAARLIGTVLYPSGDEPHYLIVAQSIWRDGDLTIENNHQRGDFKEYFSRDLAPHYLTRGANGSIYSIHPIGLPVVMAPVYALGGYRGVVAAIVILAGAAAGLMWGAVARSVGGGAATFAWAAVALTAPFLFNSFTVYPEIAGAFAVVIAFTHAIDDTRGSTAMRWLPVGLASAALPWLSTKYAPMSAALVAIAVARIVIRGSTVHGPQSTVHGPQSTVHGPQSTVGDRRRWTMMAWVLGPYGLSLVGWFSFFYRVWGTPWPQAPYGQLVQTNPFNLTFGAPGLLFDQEYGVLPYAPVYVLAITGLWRMWQSGGESRRRAAEIALTGAALLATVGAYRIWWGGSAPPGRPLTSGLLLLMLPVAVAFRDAPAASARRAAQQLLLWLSIGISGVMLFARQGMLTSNGRDGTSSVLEYLSPRWPAWSAAPSFIYHEPLTALAATGVWLVLAAVAAYLLGRIRVTRSGSAALAATAVCGMALLTGAILVPRLPAEPAWPGIDVRARARSAVLDEFDVVARPIGVEYTPWQIVSAAAVTSHTALEVDPGSRQEPEPIRVLHNARFSLPAGRYRVDVTWSGQRIGESIGLQLGRTGEPWQSWPVEPRAGERWSTEFALPLDVNFVGLRGTPELERVIARIAVVPLTVVDAHRRPRLPTVIAASGSATASFFYHDENAMAESSGFWVRGGRTTRVTIVRGRAEGRLRLRINSGLIANRLHVIAPGWSQMVVLAPRLPAELEVPSRDHAIMTLEFAADATFVPRELDSSSSDARPLGVWIEVAPS